MGVKASARVAIAREQLLEQPGLQGFPHQLLHGTRILADGDCCSSVPDGATLTYVRMQWVIRVPDDMETVTSHLRDARVRWTRGPHKHFEPARNNRRGRAGRQETKSRDRL